MNNNKMWEVQKKTFTHLHKFPIIVAFLPPSKTEVRRYILLKSVSTQTSSDP